ncbi:HAD-IA family hydrolase [Fodinisporobacter ferrooxydans]|uniref:HAD-IA family hydrolase n=1 Tax=Fodinisporobacter ferrooxydans TaxID=2901836 RepID=A0ABY4CKL8_9BACL|nr:HAD-IA family hydrolase [Alicyclobacillaceae bacterium MYW30-H2]
MNWDDNSHYAIMAKPEEDIYLLVADALGMRPHEALFIDDKERNTLAVDRLGCFNR